MDQLVPELLARIGKGGDATPRQASGHSALAWGLGVATGAMIITAAILGGITISTYIQQNNARNAMLAGELLPGNYADSSIYSSTQSSLRITAAVTDVSMVLAVGLGVGTVIAW